MLPISFAKNDGIPSVIAVCPKAAVAARMVRRQDAGRRIGGIHVNSEQWAQRAAPARSRSNPRYHSNTGGEDDKFGINSRRKIHKY